MSSVQAVFFPEPHRAEVDSFSIPDPADDELLVRTEYSGISQGTEIWAYNGKRPELRFPTIPGYQSIGRIAAVGSKRHDFSEGTRVMVRSSRVPPPFPETWMGGHMSHLIAKEAVAVPEGCDPVGAALSALAAVSLRGINMLEIGIGDTVLVTGQGLIGQCSAQLARLRGATVIATDVLPSRLEVSRRHSADITINVREENLRQAISSRCPKGVDAIIETTGRSDQFPVAIDLLRWEGQLLLQGWYPEVIPIEFHATHLKKPRIAVTCGFDMNEVAICLELQKRGKLNLRHLVSHAVPYAEAAAVYSALSSGDPSYIGVVFDWTASPSDRNGNGHASPAGAETL